jgi:hypothetical protein
VFYHIDVGIWLLHREVWHACGGYDERMIYMNDMEIDMVTRLMSKYPIVNLGELVDYDFYHLDHYHPWGSRSSATHRRVNNGSPKEVLGFQPNGSDWGLAASPLSVASQNVEQQSPVRRNAAPAFVDFPLFLLFSSHTALRLALDRLMYPIYPVWRRRARIAWATVRGQPLIRWPGLLRRIWIERPSAQARSLGRPEIPYGNRADR